MYVAAASCVANAVSRVGEAEKIARNNHVPVLIHVKDLTQPLGHSSSGSHQRYKSDERLDWEKEYDCNKKMREWILENKIVNSKDLDKIESDSKKSVSESKIEAKRNSVNQTINNISELNTIIKENINSSNPDISAILDKFIPYEVWLFCMPVSPKWPLSNTTIAKLFGFWTPIDAKEPSPINCSPSPVITMTGVSGIDIANPRPIIAVPPIPPHR